MCHSDPACYNVIAVQQYDIIFLRRVTLLNHSYAVPGQHLGQILVSGDNTNVGHDLCYVISSPSLVLL